MLKLPEVAQRLNVSEKTVRRYVKAGVLPSSFIGNAYRVSEEAIDEYLQHARVEIGDDLKKEQAPSPEQETTQAIAAVLERTGARTRHLTKTIPEIIAMYEGVSYDNALRLHVMISEEREAIAGVEDESLQLEVFRKVFISAGCLGVIGVYGEGPEGHIRPGGLDEISPYTVESVRIASALLHFKNPTERAKNRAGSNTA